MGVFGKSILVRGASASKIDVVDLCNEASKGSGSDINLLSVIGSTSSINIEAGEDFTNRFVYTKNNLEYR